MEASWQHLHVTSMQIISYLPNARLHLFYKIFIWCDVTTAHKQVDDPLPYNTGPAYNHVEYTLL